jgi:hypothetical protein
MKNGYTYNCVYNYIVYLYIMCNKKYTKNNKTDLSKKNTIHKVV